MLKIGIDAGHGFNTSGKRTPDGEREWTFNDKVLKAFVAEIQTYEGVEVKRFDDATGKTDVPLKTRTDGSNKYGADIHISFHHNANAGVWGTHGGVETHVYKTKPASSVKLAELVQPELVKAYGLKDRGVKFTDLHITRETHCTSILVEGGFMDSTVDIEKLRDDEVLKNAGKGIAQAVAKFAELKKKVVKPAPVKPVVPSKPAKVEDPKPVKKPVVKPAPKPAKIKIAGRIKVVGVKHACYICDKPSVHSKNVGTARLGSTLLIAGSVNGWWEVIHNGKRAYVTEKFGKLVK